MAELSPEVLVQEILARNPSLTQMTAAWQAATARYPQVTSLEDPMLGGYVGPASIGSKDVDFGYRLEVSQKIPFPGKRGLRGQNALAEASAAGNEVEDMRLQLVESARLAFADYYLVFRALAVNEEGLQILQELRKSAEQRFRTGQVTQQDVLQADVEIGRQHERLLVLERLRRVSVARINTLMHLPPDLPLPAAPKEIHTGGALPEAARLREIALSRRPDLQALTDRIAAEQAALALARKEVGPDFELMAAYDAFWQTEEKDLRPQIGLKLNLPIYKARRSAAIAEAEARLMQRQAEWERQIDQVNFDVQQAFELVRESERTVVLYQKTILPAASENVKAAQAAYITAKVPFLTLSEAQRNAVMLRDRYYEAIAEHYRRLATLERVIGGPLEAKPGQCPAR
jgi:outer membrane protein TolC